MFTEITYQDWERAQDKTKVLKEAISSYKGSADFRQARIAEGYYTGNETEIQKKYVMKPRKTEVRGEDGRSHKYVTTQEIVGARINSNFFARFVMQEASFLLGNGVTVRDQGAKEKLGPGFDTVLAEMGRKALIHGCCWGYWNLNHLEMVEAYKDPNSGAFALLDEMTGEPGVVIQFWQMDDDRPMYVRLFESDGVSMFRSEGDDNIVVIERKRPYILRKASDAFGTKIIGGQNYKRLPIIALYANGQKRSELTPAIKSKLDAYNIIQSDFADNLEQANDVFWVLNNFGGSTDDIVDMLDQISKLKVVANISDGMGGGSTAQPQAFEVPYLARRTALDILKRELYSDYMAIDMDSIMGGSLTNVAIKAATMDLNLKCDEFEWQAFDFVQRILELIGIETEQISFVRQTLINQAETLQNIYMARSDLDRRTALLLNPMISHDDVDLIMAAVDEEETGRAEYSPDREEPEEEPIEETGEAE